MTLFAATLITGAILLALGIIQLLWPNPSRKFSFSMLRSKKAAVLFLGIAALWFLWHVWHLGEPEFGNHKNKLLVGFSVLTLLSFYFIPDFLAVRGLAALLLLSSNELLRAAYMEPPVSRLFLVSFVYLLIVFSMYFAALPYRLRDFLTWLHRNPLYPKLFASSMSVYGILLCALAFTY